ncbi:tetratricopeptide repeat protein [Mucilaginibacter sp. OK098]|uniref:tetratricopeptide repeat protein n=1 Tax=Mucilaginibacter sp. OK098 TaxID=1855297 RepID=UPI0009348E4A|nr:hypothetical protein [Mucilaginibacter sp. OK098]
MKPNQRKILSALIIIICFCSCAKPKRKINPLSIKLNDSAMQLVMHFGTDDKSVVNGINLLDKAIRIDSNYVTAYWNKFSFQNQLKQYNEALETVKHLLKLRPNDALIIALTGLAYEKTGDTISAAKCYKNALSNYDKILDTMNLKNKSYCGLATGKAMILKLLNKNEQSDAYLKGLLQTETDPVNKQLYEESLRDSRNDVLYGKGDTVSENANPVKH